MKRIVASIVFFMLLLFSPSTIYAANPVAHPILRHVTPWHMKAGFSINTVAAVDNAASLGINTAIIYGTPYTPADPVGAEMLAKGMHEVDGGIASELFYYECHRTHTVALPPSGQTNTYCATDVQPAINSESALLAAIDTHLQADAANPLILGYWVLDDWAIWDSGSAKLILPAIHAHIQNYTPFYPAICGFGVAIDKPGISDWIPGLALNYSNSGCDRVGIYSYISSYATYMDGSQFDFTLKAGLSAVLASLLQQGWNSQNTPLLGIGQAFAGTYATTSYEPGITVAQMQTEATAFCQAGANAIGWYGWSDSGFGNQTLTPMTSTIIQSGIKAGIGTCQGIWGGH